MQKIFTESNFCSHQIEGKFIHKLRVLYNYIPENNLSAFFFTYENIFYNEKIELRYVCVCEGVRRGTHYVLVWELLAFGYLLHCKRNNYYLCNDSYTVIKKYYSTS